MEWGIMRHLSKRCQEVLVGARCAFSALEEGSRKQGLARGTVVQETGIILR